MLEGGIDGKDIGVISPYNYQVQHIRRLLTSDDLDMLEVHTIDRYQVNLDFTTMSNIKF
jgi:superfamily I DNA and/or RNA helicase